LKIFIVDDSDLVRERLVESFAKIKGLEVAGQAQSATEAMQAIQNLKPDIVTLDIRMAGGNGFSTLRKIKATLPATIVIMLTKYAYPEYREKCMALGADFLFDKAEDFSGIFNTIQQLCRQSNSEK
jgi:DNA-binding NarL/FixJ family response regulator